MAEVEQEIQRELRRCTTREERDTCWKKSKKYIVDTAEELKTKMEDEVRTISFNNEDGSTTLEQWKKDMIHKISMQKRSQEMSVIACCEATFNYLQQRQDVEEMQQSYEKQLMEKADYLMSDQIANEEEESKKIFVEKESKQTTEKNYLNDFDKEKKNEENITDNIVKEENVYTSKDRIDHVTVERDSKQTTEENSLADICIKEKKEKSENVENVKDNIIQKEKENASNISVHCVKGRKEFRQDFELGVTPNKTEKISHKIKQDALSELCERLGLKTKLTLKHARTFATFTDDELTSHDQIPSYILKMLMMANHQAREFKLEPLKKYKVIIKSNDDGTGVSDSDDTDEDDSDDSDSDDESEAVEGINPMDALLGIFYCSDDFLRRDLAVKLSECQLSVPFILPVPDDPAKNPTVLLSALEKITKSWKDATSEDSSKVVYATEHPFPVVSFIRLGIVTMSKSSLMNKIISDGNGDHDFFFHKNIKGGDVERKVVDGLVELVWYLPGGNKKNSLQNEICFTNLRGNAQSFKKQVNVLREISNILCILLPSKMPDKRMKNFLDEAIMSKGKTLLIFNEKRQKEVKKYYKDLERYHRTKLSSCTKASKSNVYEFFNYVRKVIQSNIKEAEDSNKQESKLKSLANLKCQSKECGVYFDDDPAYAKLEKTVEIWISDGIQNAKNLFKLQGHVPILADLEKKIQNPKFRPTIKQEDVVNELYQERENEEKAQIESFNSMNKDVTKFLYSLTVMNEWELNRNLHHLKYLLDKVSLSVMTDLHKEYRRALLSVKEPTKNTQSDRPDSQTKEEKNLNKLEELILKSSFGLEHIIREIAQLYQLTDVVVNDYAGVAAKILLSGEPLELLDGDSGYIPMKWFNAVYEELEMQTNNASIYVISVLGIKSSGKSTMLNTMFCLEFPVSAGRFTRGTFVSLVPVSEHVKCDSNFDYVLIIDTEGLKGMADPIVREHDNELATFAVGVADVTIVNIFGENYNEMKEFLAMSVHAFLKMKLVKDKKSCKIVHQNVAANDAADKLMMDRRNLKQNLDHMARLAAIQENCDDQFQKLDDIIAFDENKDVFYIPSLLKGSPPMAPINPNYGRDLQKVKENVIQQMCSKEVVKLTVSSFRKRVKDLWQAMLKENFIFSFRNVIEIRAYASLDKKLFKESVKLMVNGMAEIERSIERDLKRCTTRQERNKCWMSNKRRIFAEAEELKMKMEKEMQTFFESSEDKSTLEQWKEDVMEKIKRYKRNQVASVIENCEATFHHLQQQQDVEEMKKIFEMQLLCRAKKLMSSQKTNDEEECKATFQKEWKQWIGEVPPCEEVRRDVNQYMVHVLLPENSDLRADMLMKLEPKKYRISPFFYADPVIDNSMLSFKGGYFSKVVQNVYKWFIHDAISRANFVKNKVISQGKMFVERVSNIAVRFTTNDLITMYDEIISTIDKETEKQNMKFKKPLVCDILLYTFARAFPIFDKMEDRYVEERDILRNLEKTLRPRLEKYFINLCKEMEKEVLAATSLVDVLREPIKSKLNKGIVTAVDTKLLTKSMFLSKAHFHATVLIQLGENPSFELFVPYLKNPIQFLENKLKEYVEDFCLNTESKLVRSLLKDEGERLKSNIFSAIEDANKKARNEIERGSESWKVMNWIEKFVEQCPSLAITKEMFGFATLDEDLKETDLFDKKVREFVEDFVQILTDAELDSETISNWQPAPHKRLSKLLLECQAVCPFCKALCDQTMDYQQYSTNLHRPLGLAGHYNSKTKILISDICTFLVAGNDTFKNIDTNWQPHPYKDYQSVNDYYKSWKIPPDRSYENSKYWQWFMVKFSKQLAKHYEAKEAKIPSSWKSVTFSEAVKQLKEQYNL
ncbi:interferon-induced very large GTPase 1-like [Xenia sp. Carnegie-2017]|uniref:interferon-induced very large GTPase 1-like n=1 Tax=Xenia sp. Carnegie-2017 TaxID=2897299 RepID=UPI001F03CC06|nr:interferon-induced very large GTPase 1-like [Xenia sp. Carnegie-2017]